MKPEIAIVFSLALIIIVVVFCAMKSANTTVTTGVSSYSTSVTVCGIDTVTTDIKLLVRWPDGSQLYEDNIRSLFYGLLAEHHYLIDGFDAIYSPFAEMQIRNGIISGVEGMNGEIVSLDVSVRKL